MSSRERRLLDKDIQIRKLQGELKHYKTCFFSCVFEKERTHKALDVAVDALKKISLRYSEERNAPEGVWTIAAIDMAEYADNALDQITALEQKDIK